MPSSSAGVAGQHRLVIAAHVQACAARASLVDIIEADMGGVEIDHRLGVPAVACQERRGSVSSVSTLIELGVKSLLGGYHLMAQPFPKIIAFGSFMLRMEIRYVSMGCLYR